MSDALMWVAGALFGIELVLVIKVLNRKADAIAKWIADHTPGNDDD